MVLLFFCFSVLSDESRGNWPATGAVRGRRSPGFGYGKCMAIECFPI